MAGCFFSGVALACAIWGGGASRWGAKATQPTTRTPAPPRGDARPEAIRQQAAVAHRVADQVIRAPDAQRVAITAQPIDHFGGGFLVQLAVHQCRNLVVHASTTSGPSASPATAAAAAQWPRARGRCASARCRSGNP